MKEDENRATSFFKIKGIAARKISTRISGKTPDLELHIGKSHFGQCEVKSITTQDFLGKRPDPTYNNIQNKIHDASKQFQDYEPYHSSPNLLFFANHHPYRGFIDLWLVLTGQTSFSKYPAEILDVRYIKRLREKGDLDYIDFIIWFDVMNDMAFYSKNGKPKYAGILKDKVSCSPYEKMKL